MSGMASALQNHSPMVVLGGRAPAFRWGQGSLQEIDHVPFVRPVVKLAATAGATPEIPGLVDEAFAVARRPHTGPVFLDFPLDVVFIGGRRRGEPRRRRLRARGRPTAPRSTARWRCSTRPSGR